jgi:N-acetylmuramoyl-L-alanine amidase
MQVRIAARTMVWAAVALCCASAAWPDTLIVRGKRIRTSVRFEVEGEEVWAPLLDGLGYLGAKHEITNDAIRITTANGREVLISRKRPEATRDGMLREMPGLPKVVRRKTFLPARAVGSLLGCAVRWEEDSRTLYLHPWVRKFSLAQLHDRYRLTVEAEAPISYRIGELTDPPRYFIDLLNIDLAQIPSAFAAEESYLKSARIHQHSVAPDPEGDVARIVVEMAERRQCRIRESDDKCRLEIDLPLPGAEELSPDVEPVVLTDIAFERRSPRVAAVKLGVFGTAYCTSVNMYDPLLVAVDVINATNQIRSPMPFVEDSLVESVDVGPAPGHPGTERVTVALKQPTGHGIVVDDGEVRILLGRFELAELKVVVDAGHGGHDTGAVGRSGLQEKEVNLNIALRVYRLLKAMGVNVCLTRVGDNAVRPWTRGNRQQQKTELLTRCQIANQMEADLFVSIHANARRSNPMEHRGTETYYRRPESFAFAHAMQRELVQIIGLPDGGVIRHPKSIIVLRYTKMPSILVEVGYLSHPADEALLATEELRERAAMGIVNGVRKYVEQGGLLDKLALRARQSVRPADN